MASPEATKSFVIEQNGVKTAIKTAVKSIYNALTTQNYAADSTAVH